MGAADYVLNDNVSFSVELERYGKVSNLAKGTSLTVGARFTLCGGFIESRPKVTLA